MREIRDRGKQWLGTRVNISWEQMVQGLDTGGRGQGLSVLRAVLIAGCVVLGLALAVVLLLAVVYRQPTAEEVI